MRVGLGYDSHRFAAGRPLILGGVEIPHEQGLAGHSDADAVAHAATDALLGAAALGDIGVHFPPDDPKWKNADSIELLRAAARMIQEHGQRAANIDITLVCEAPRIGPHIERMRGRLAGAAGLDPARVSIKATTNEGMGWIGRGEGIAALAVALVAPTDG